MEPLPEYILRTGLANIIYNNRRNAIITWGNYVNSDKEDLKDHAIKYYLQFPEIFIPEGPDNPILPSARRKFEKAVTQYGERAKEIIKDSNGTEIYAFHRDGLTHFLAYKPDTKEVVGFRIRQGKWNNWEIAIDTFYKASEGMIESLRDEGIIELLIDSEGDIATYDVHPDAFRIQRRPEQIEEFSLFGLKKEMYQEAIDIVIEKILSRSDIGVIMIAGTSAAGKSPGTEIIQAYLAQEGRNTKVLPMDNYFIDRELVPFRNGKPDYDNPETLNIERFKKDVNRLLRGEEVELPRYDFDSGRSISKSGVKLKLDPGDILIIEGIHALNPLLTGSIKKKIPQVRLFIDASPRLRLARRLVRDWDTRGIEPIQTIRLWKNVRNSEDTYIYPTMEYADESGVINTDLLEEEFISSELYERLKEALERAYREAEIEEDAELMKQIEELMLDYFGTTF
jgi:uridine kinase